MKFTRVTGDIKEANFVKVRFFTHTTKDNKHKSSPAPGSPSKDLRQ